MNYNYKEIESFLQLELPKTQEEVDTFLSISGFPHYENVISNIYAFYFDRNNNHGFDDLFIRSLFNAIKKQNNIEFNSRLQYLEDWSSWNVYREESINKKRIDILLEECSEEESRFIIIENKINAGLYNPLETYWSYSKTDKKVGVVLSLFKEKINHSGFINITHHNFLQEVKSLQGQYIETASSRDFLILKDLITNIKQQEGMSKDSNLLYQFYQKNINQIENIHKLRNDVKTSFLTAVVHLGEQVLKTTVKYKNAISYRTIIDKDEEDIHIGFYFENDYEANEHSFSIGIELYGDLEKRKDEILENNNFLDEYKLKGFIINDDRREGQWCRVALKYYKFDDIDFDTNKLKDLYDRDWILLVEDIKKRIK